MNSALWLLPSHLRLFEDYVSMMAPLGSTEPPPTASTAGVWDICVHKSQLAGGGWPSPQEDGSRLRSLQFFVYLGTCQARGRHFPELAVVGGGGGRAGSGFQGADWDKVLSPLVLHSV